MAEETKKSTTTTKKRTTTSKPKVEEPKPQLSIEEQMAQMMAMMMAQQQQLMELMAKQQEPVNMVVEEEVIEKPKPKRQRNTEKMTKQELRRKYRDVDIYLTNITQGIVSYKGKNMSYHWENTGDVEVVTIDDIVNMPKKYLNAPWLVIDGYENAEEVIDDIVTVLKLEPVYEYVDIIHDIHEDINSVTLEDIERAIKLSRKRGYDITLDLVVLIQRKIDSKELTNFHMISELQKLLGRKFL
jgi:hypothetical protein